MAYLGKSPSQGVRNRYYFTASGGETSISGALTGGTLTFTDGNYVDVNLNGVTLVAGTDYNTSTANTIAGLSALTASDVVEIVVYDVFSVFSGNVNSDFSVGGNLSVTGTTAFTGATTITGLTTTGDITFGDNDKAIFGAGSDLQIFHSGTNSFISDEGTGNLYLGTNGTSVSITKGAGGENMGVFTVDGAVTLYHNNLPKIATTSTGIDVTGNATFADNGKAIFGASSDLQIYHDGSNSYVKDAGTGDLLVQGTQIKLQDAAGNDYLRGFTGGSVYLHHAGNNKFETTSTGVAVTGNVVLNNATYLQFKDSGGTARDVLAIDAFNGLNINSAGGGAAAPIVFKENGSEIARFDTSGNLLVGTSTIYGQITSESNGTKFQYASHNTDASGVNQVSFRFMRNTADVGSITTTASATAYNTSSDYRLKENVTADWDATTRLKQLNPVRFNFISDADTTVDGFLAHEVQSIVPEAITGTKDEVDADGNPVMQGIDQSKLVPLLVKTIIELEARIAALET